LAVRWHLFAGLLFDLKAERSLPWKLRLHFTNYPSFSDMILPLEQPVLNHVQASYKHSLKQAMTIESGNSRNAMNVTKESHGLLWDAIRYNNVAFFQRVDLPTSKQRQQSTTSIVAIPVRVLVNATNPPLQRRVDGSDSSLTIGELLAAWLPEHFVRATTVEPDDTTTHRPEIAPNESVTCWRVSGIEPPLTTPILELWRQCAHPDQFLYIVVLTR
jgi:Autophagy protein Apg5